MKNFLSQDFPPIIIKFFGYNIHDVWVSIVVENEWPSQEQLRSVLVHFSAKCLQESTITHSSDTSSTMDSICHDDFLVIIRLERFVQVLQNQVKRGMYLA